MKNNLNTGLKSVLKSGSADLPSRETIQAHLLLPPVQEPLAYDIKQSAAKLNTCTKTVRRLLKRGKLTSCRETRKILIPREQIENFFKRTCDKPNLDA